ncbi:hypothetical protein LTR84_003695 [Exophiala bonariae]|uniref:NmrA-like domain-containing protein n=1 Tax=Exophiala bonariae TaxID=1690606 RepID=A0AAV9N6R5_9EURO|nr:hypothetical protein LTR84_003695 [Exophiala bonariae]
MARNLAITAVDGYTGFTIADYILQNDSFRKKIGTLTGLTLAPNSPHAKELAKQGVKIVTHKPGRLKEMVALLESTGADTICLIPPAHEEKFGITEELIEATKKANVPNVCFISTAGCDLADPNRQPVLREFVELETLVMAAKGDPGTSTGHSPVIIRPGFYAENLLLYKTQIQEEHSIPLPIGENHKFAPMALKDLANVAAHVLTGPLLCAGKELAEAASQALETEIQFENISEREAKKVLTEQSSLNPAELRYLLEYYALVREGKTNYISTTAFHDVTGQHPLEPPEFFKGIKNELLAASTPPSKKRKTNGH